MYFSEFLNQYPWLLMFGQLILAWVISVFMYPGLIYLSHLKKLNVPPAVRSAHTTSTSILGGVGIFFTFILTTIGAFLLYGSMASPLIFLALLASLFIMFFLGLKDDIVSISPAWKALVQLLISVLFLSISGDLVVDFGTLFGNHVLPVWLSWVFTLFIYLLGINAYNLIDGVNGLAGGVAAAATCYFGVSFALMGDHQWAFISFGALGGILGFLRFNLSSKRSIFMGDNGSLFIGFLLVSLSLHYLYSPINVRQQILGHDILSVLALFSYPLIDVARVFLVRVKNGYSPFSADKNHLHHFLLKLGFSHRQITIIVVTYTILMVLLMNTMAFLDVYIPLIILLCINILVAFIPSIIYRKANRIIVRLPWLRST